MNTNKRIEYLDLLKGFTIILVVLAHMLKADNLIKNYIYSFHMPLFFVISGYCNRNKNGFIKNNIKKRIKSLLIPYISFSLLIIVLKLIQFGFAGNVKSYIYYFLMGTGMDALWFLPCLFLIEIYDAININKRWYIVLGLLLVGLFGDEIYSSLFLTTIYRSFIGLFFYTLGKITNIIERKYSNVTLIIAMIIVFALSYFNGSVDLWGLNFNYKIIYILTSVIGSVAMIGLFRNYSCIISKLKILNKFGMNTIIILATQQYIIDLIKQFANKEYFNTITGILLTCSIMLIEIPIIYLINNYTPFMLGKFKKKEKTEIGLA